MTRRSGGTHDIEMQVASEEFAKCWVAAGIHLQSRVQDGIQSWLRAHLAPPFLEHLSFRLGNQLFFVRIEDVDDDLEVPSGRGGLRYIAEGCNGHACLMPMRRSLAGEWTPARPDWGLLDARTMEPVDPILLVTDEKIEVSAWELQEFAVQVVRDQLIDRGYKLMSWQGNPVVDPAIWFVGDSKGPEWVVVRAVRYPDKEAKRPGNWDDIAESCAKLGPIGHFASLAFASPDQREGEEPIPIWRGYLASVEYDGLT
jgi:hypothetical protein